MNNEELTKLVDRYNADPNCEQALHEEFCKLAEEIHLHKSYNFKCDNAAYLYDGAAELCLTKTKKCNGLTSTRNFFITVIGCYLRQEHRIVKNARKVK